MDKLLKPRSIGKRKIVYSKERQIIYCILDVYTYMLPKKIVTRVIRANGKRMETDESYKKKKNETK